MWEETIYRVLNMGINTGSFKFLSLSLQWNIKCYNKYFNNEYFFYSE